MAQSVTCPFCGFISNGGGYAIQLHIEEHHTEDSPFVVNDATPASKPPSTRERSSRETSDSEENPWIKCTRQGCGEYVLISDIDDHLELHEIASQSEDQSKNGRDDPRRPDSREASSTYDQRRLDSREGSSKDHRRTPQKLQRSRPPESTTSQRRGLLEYITGQSVHGQQQMRRQKIREPLHPGRLGKRELGPHAFEKRMPDEVRKHLLSDAEPRYVNQIGRDGRLDRKTTVENETGGLIPILADLCALDRTTVATYFCDPSVRHVVKIRCDGNFCGYWNIQMMLSYLQSRQAKPSGDGNARERLLPNVLQIQDAIEQAWDAEICSYGRIETGGVRGTRKWIGTHEALAYFTQIGVDVEALSFKEEEGSDTSSSQQPAVLALLDHVEAYFISALETTKDHGTSHTTSLPPIYFQRFGHSMTIVGLERKRSGERNLLVFDPSFATTAPMSKLLAGRQAYVQPDTVLKPYRRTDASLSRWEEFEIIVPKTATIERRTAEPK